MLPASGLRVGVFGSGRNPLAQSACSGWRVVGAATKVKPRITRLRGDEVAQVLPWAGSGEQRLQKLGTPSTWMTRLAVSLAGSAMFYNYNTMAAAVASLYWAWDPLLSTAFANTALRLQYPYAGLWRARVLSANVVTPSRPSRRDDVFQEIFESQSTIKKPFLQLVIGDGSAATLEMKVGLPGKKKQVQVGEPVEVLVVSDVKSLSRFMALRDVYLPEMGIWLSEDPCIERPVFEELVETLRAPGVSFPLTTKGRGTPTMIPESSVDRKDFATERQTARRWRLTQLDYEELDSAVDADPKLQALRRLSQTQNDAKADLYGPPRQYMRMQEYSSDSEDFWDQDNSNMVRDDAQAADNESDVDEEPKKFQPPKKLTQEPRKLEFQRSLQADAYGPPMEYMRMQEYGSEVERESEDAAQVPDNDVKANQAEQLTTVAEFLGNGRNEVRTRDVELVQEEEL